MNTTKWDYFDYQKQHGELALAKLRELGMIILGFEERCGKSATALYAVEHTNENVQNVLIITKVKARDGWQEHIDNLPLKKHYYIETHGGYNRLPHTNWDIVLIDEQHKNFGSYPNPSKTVVQWHKTGIFDKTPIIFMSATTVHNSFSTIYHQLVLSDYSPFSEFKDFRDWFGTYGKPKVKYLGTRTVPDYSHTHETKILEVLEPYLLKLTRKELNFKVHAQDQIHYITLAPQTIARIVEILEDEILTLPDGRVIPILTKPQERTAIWQLEGGTLKINTDETDPTSRESFFFSTEKVQWILNNFEDTEDLIIFYHFQLEYALLSHNFKRAHILQGMRYSEGVDLSKYKHAVVFSLDESTATYSQRRNRQININRADEVVVHYLLVKGGLSEAIYTSVAVNKVNFINRLYSSDSLNYQTVTKPKTTIKFKLAKGD